MGLQKEINCFKFRSCKNTLFDTPLTCLHMNDLDYDQIVCNYHKVVHLHNVTRIRHLTLFIIMNPFRLLPLHDPFVHQLHIFQILFNNLMNVYCN